MPLSWITRTLPSMKEMVMEARSALDKLDNAFMEIFDEEIQSGNFNFKRDHYLGIVATSTKFNWQRCFCSKKECLDWPARGSFECNSHNSRNRVSDSTSLSISTMTSDTAKQSSRSNHEIQQDAFLHPTEEVMLVDGNNLAVQEVPKMYDVANIHEECNVMEEYHLEPEPSPPILRKGDKSKDANQESSEELSCAASSQIHSQDILSLSSVISAESGDSPMEVDNE